MKVDIQRCWINQPSANQPLHHLHGTNVLAYREGESTYRVYFLEGVVISQQVPVNALSKGWVYHTSKKGVKA